MLSNKIKIYMSIILLLIIFWGISGCKKQTKFVDSGKIEYIKVENFKFNGEPNILNFADIPKRVIVCGNSAIDTLIYLGVGDSIITAVITENIDITDYRNKLPNAEIFVRPISQEYAVLMQPDFIIGQRRFFSEKLLGGPSFWGNKKVPAYIQEASGPIPSLRGFPPCTIESEKRFLINMGAIFRKEKEVKKFIDDIDNEIKVNLNNNTNKPKVLVIEFMGKNIELFGKALLSGNIVEALDAEIIDLGYPFINIEDLMFMDADVIFVVYHGNEKNKEFAMKKINNHIFNRMKAVRNGKVYPLQYQQIVAPAIHTVDTIKAIRQGIYGN